MDSFYCRISDDDTSQTKKQIKLIDNKDGTFSVATSDVSMAISRGDIAGSSRVGAYGKLVSTGSVVDSVIWADGVWSAIPAIGARISIVSTSASDSAAGTGIRSLDILYLDSGLNPHIETVTLNGTTPVLTTATNIRFIQCGHMLTYGTGKKAAGIITFKDSATTATYNQINAGDIRCSSSARMVPKGKRLFVSGVVASITSTTSDASGVLSLTSTHFDGHDFTADSILFPLVSIAIQNSALAYSLPILEPFGEGAVVAMTCSVDKAATITANWFGHLENA